MLIAIWSYLIKAIESVLVVLNPTQCTVKASLSEARQFFRLAVPLSETRKAYEVGNMDNVGALN